MRVVGDIGDEPVPDDAFAGADAVVHLAARVHVIHDSSNDPLADYRRVNVRGTENVARAAVRAGVGRFVFLSTTNLGEVRGEGPFSEQTTPRPVNPYGKSKLEAEDVLRSIGDLQTTILRPPLVYGPGVGAKFFRLMRAIELGAPFPFGAVQNRRSMIFVRNLTDAICTVTDSRQNGTFLVSDGVPISTPDLIRAIADAMGRDARLVSVPPSILRFAGRITGNASVVERLTYSLEIDDACFRGCFRWRPPFPMSQALNETVRWFRNRKERQ